MIKQLKENLKPYGKLLITNNSKGKFLAKVKSEHYIISSYPSYTLLEAIASLQVRLNKDKETLKALQEVE